ncbi:MAG: GGDEF domain-containing protein [Sphingopyxis sp.]|uniref:GGDEF domain-containing protein n=1 Tax=Sphingopyxis sp. TaxID=1908224 RepID=UPI002AB97B4C|nr:GGDEF domain-containing protein [Sphingopyxis sp.]MDZ3830568.1 GGDEF domain-containing protein [Sphingopyxis sp.]
MLFAMLVLAFGSSPAEAAPLRLNDTLCHAVGGTEPSDDMAARLTFACDGTPTDYRRGSLWLRADLSRLSLPPRDLALMVHQTRFDRLAVAFLYADGILRWQHVRQGDYASHWRVGGQIMFEAPDRSAPIRAVIMRFDGMADHALIRARLMPKGDAVVQSANMAAAVGAALTLLLVGAIYSLSLAVAVRRQYLAWQAGWSGTMLLWGALWSQVHLALFPGMAGTVTAQACTFLACAAVALASVSAVKAIDRNHGSAVLRRAALALGAGVGIAGFPVAWMPGGNLELWGQILGLAVLADLIVVTVFLGLAWRRGSVEARDFLAAWGLPMATLAFIHIVDVGEGIWGGGAQLPVLFAATWQALWLAAAATRRLGQLRVERDIARAAEAQASRLARHDPLTGLPNRRGFIESVTPLLDRARSDNLPAALLLVDIDRFKSINDVHGHEAGDAVLCAIGRRIARWEGAMCTVARMGGEEFGLVTIGMEGIILERFAESVRRGIAACDHGALLGDRVVTASVGVAVVRPACDFQNLYRLADEALYDAKREGRDRVVIRRRDESPNPAFPGTLPSDGPLPSRGLSS